MNRTIRDAYISVEIADGGLEKLREGLRSLFHDCNVDCEIASSAAHVSIAYGEGDVEMEALERVASEIASLPFSVNVVGFEILPGQTTPYDYLVVSLEGHSFGAAQSVASGCMKTREFHGGFSSHVSLLKFPRGSVSRAHKILAEMNETQAVARAFKRRALIGSKVGVFGADKQCRITKAFIAA